MTNLSDLERAVLELLLRGDHPILNRLRIQLLRCRVTRRESTAAGFFTGLETVDAPAVDDINLRLGDVVLDAQSLAHGAGFVLFVDHGRLTMLEGFTYDEAWPSQLDGYVLKYLPGEHRDWSAVKAQLDRAANSDDDLRKDGSTDPGSNDQTT